MQVSASSLLSIEQSSASSGFQHLDAVLLSSRAFARHAVSTGGCAPPAVPRRGKDGRHDPRPIEAEPQSARFRILRAARIRAASASQPARSGAARDARRRSSGREGVETPIDAQVRRGRWSGAAADAFGGALNSGGSRSGRRDRLNAATIGSCCLSPRRPAAHMPAAVGYGGPGSDRRARS